MSAIAEESSSEAFDETVESGTAGDNRWVDGVDSVLKVTDWILEALAITALIVIMLLTCANAAMRYLFSDPIPGSVNITLMYLMPALVFLALPRVQAVDAHIAATLFVDKLGDTGKKICRAIVTLIAVAIMLLMFRGACHELGEAWGTTLGGYPALPVGPSWLFVPIGLAGAVIRGIWQLATMGYVRKRDESMLGEMRTDGA